MGIEDVVRNNKSESEGSDELDPEMDPEDVSITKQDWKFLIAHEPNIATRVAWEYEEKEAKVMVAMMRELLEEGHDEFKVFGEMEKKLKREMERIEQKYKPWD